MKIGVKKVNINPEFAVDLAGFGVPDRKSEGIHDDISLNVLIMEHGGKRSLIICADIIGFDIDIVKSLKTNIYQRFGFKEEEVFFNASHTHSGPQTLTYMLGIVGKPNNEYIDSFKSKLFLAIADGMNDIEEVELYVTNTKSDIGISRRLIQDGKAVFAPNEEGIIDDNVVVLKFMRNEKVKAVMFNYACHPSIVCTNYISADYPGCAKKVIEDYYGEGVIAFFLQGCCGDIKARTLNKNHFRAGLWDDVERLGKILGQNVIEACESDMLEIHDINIIASISHISLPLKSIPSRSYYESLKRQNDTNKVEWADKMLLKYDELSDKRPFVLQRISLSDKFMFLGLSGEVCSDYSIYARKLFDGGFLAITGYTNGTEGYIPTEKMFDEGGYESQGSYMYFSFPAEYDNSIEKIVKNEIDIIIKKI